MATELIRGLYNFSSQNTGCVATIGNFDGVHLGHQALFAAVKKQASLLQLPSVVITFEPQPAEFFKGKPTIPRLTRWREKFAAIAECGMDKMLVLPFNQSVAELSAEQFIEQVLAQGMGVRHVIVGEDFRFGRARLGDVAFLKQVGAQYHLTAESMPSVMLEGERVSSTRVRRALADADHSLVERLLGHPFCMEGRVARGDARGRSMGFPTANIHLHRQLAPVQGVYAVRMHGLAKTGLPGVANVGIRPTVGGTRSILEVHLFDFEQEIYGRHVRVEFCEKLRDEKRFDSLTLLKAQIWQDAAQAKDYFVQRGE